MTGKPPHFDPNLYCDVIEQMISSDEVERAQWMLDNPPAFFRDYPTERMKEIRESLHRQLFTPAQYAAADIEGVDCDPEALAQIFPPRAQVLAEKIKALNEKGIKPNIMEIGPGVFWLPFSLRARGLEFTYEYQALNKKMLPFDAPKENGGPNILVCFELIEHLSNEAEIYQSALKFKKQMDYVYISTPLYTCSAVSSDWRNNALGHLRTYTPHDLFKVVSGLFSGYTWKLYLSDSITAEGILIPEEGSCQR